MVLFICQNGNLLPKKVAIVVGIGVLSRCDGVFQSLGSLSTICILLPFYSLRIFWFCVQWIGSTWREICAQLGFDFEQCQIHLIWMSQMQLGWLKLIEIWRRKCEVKAKSMFRGLSYLPTSTDLVMLCDCVVKMWTELGKGRAGVTNLIGNGPSCQYCEMSRVSWAYPAVSVLTP